MCVRVRVKRKISFYNRRMKPGGGGAVAVMAGKKIRPKLRAHTADGTEKVDRRQGI